MSLCITPPIATECCLADLCFECGETMPSDPGMAKDVTWSNYFIVATLFIVAVWNAVAFIRVYSSNNNHVSMMRLANTLYAFGTGIFGICRIHFQLGKPLLVFAAIHNLCEWVFVAYAFYNHKRQRENVIFCTIVWIFLVIGAMLLLIPTFPYYALAEQITGISLDFMLPIVWFVLWRQNKDTKNINYMYLIAFSAHLIHILFTIIPLVLVNFIQNHNSYFSRGIEFVIFLSVPATHILYTRFTDLFEKYVELPSNGEYADIYSIRMPQQIFGKSSAVLRMLFWYLVCVFVGLVPTVLVPMILPECSDETNGDSINPPQKYDNFIIGTSTAYVYEGMTESFEYYVQSNELIQNARKAEGNIFFYLNKDMSDDTTYFFVEAWESKEAVEKWIQSSQDRAVFNNNTYNMLVPGQLEINAYLPLNPVKPEGNIAKCAIEHVFKPFHGCFDAGEALLTVDSCEYIKGCDHVEIINAEQREQMLIFESGYKLHCFVLEPKKQMNENGQIIYSMTHQCDNGVTEHYQLTFAPNLYPSDECHLLLRYDVDTNMRNVDEVYTAYSTISIPYVQETFEINSVSMADKSSNSSISMPDLGPYEYAPLQSTIVVMS